MRKLFSIFAAVLLTASVFAQSPEKMSYQAVIRNSSDQLVTNSNIGMQISILQGSVTGTPVYVEKHFPTTNANGLVSIEIGAGTVVSGNFAAIDWANGPYFIKTETDLNGGDNYTITGTSQLLSVPYALHAKTAETVTGGITETDPVFSAWDKSTGISITESQIIDLQNYLTTETDPAVAANFDFSGAQAGDLLQFNGTKWVKVTPNYLTTETDPVFSAWDKDYNDLINKPTIPPAADGSETILTAGTNVTITGNGTTANPYVINASSSGTHYLGEEYLDGIIFYLYIGSDGQQHGLVVSKTETTAQWQNTSSTTNANRTEDGAYNTSLMTNSPAKDWITLNFSSEWYLPSIDELSILWHNRFHVNKTARAISSTLLSSNAAYWSSTEYDATNAFAFFFNDGYAYSNFKAYTYSVRAVRAF